MLTLYLIRHGKAEDLFPDEKRKLTAKGLKLVRRIAEHVTERFPKPALLFSSPLARARETAEPFAEGWKCGETLIVDWLTPNSPPSVVLSRLREEVASRLAGKANPVVALVGHMPNLGLVLSALTTGLPARELGMPKGGVALVELEALEPGAGSLRWLLTPESL
jgi:phosphohistidine phosphatase SixA